MCEKFLFVACFVALAGISDAASASFITPCKSDDSKCAKQSTQAAIPVFAAGIPELGVETLDPLNYPKIDASSRDLKFLLNDIIVTGVKGCEARKVQRDAAKSKLYVRAICNLILDGRYEMSGRLLILPIEGKGKIHVGLKKILINVEADMGEKVKDGVTYWDVKSWKHTHELKDRSEIELENLFGGNEQLAQAIRGLLASSGNEVVSEVGPPIIRAILAKVVKNVNRLFHRVPAQELALD